MESQLEKHFKESFEMKLLEYEQQHQGSQRKPSWTDEKIKEVINNIRRGKVASKSGQRRTSMEYYWMSKYDIVNIDNKFHLIFKQKNSSDPTITIVPRNEYYNVIKETHDSLNHCGRDKMQHELKNKFYIPKKAIEIFIALCPTCEGKKNSQKKGITNQPTIGLKLHTFNIQGKVKMIDFQCSPDGDFKWLLLYQDDSSKFVSLRPLKTKDETEVALELFKIFMTFGAPNVLQSDNGSKFTEKLIENLTVMCPEWDIINETRSSHSQGNDRITEDIEILIHLWMTNKKSSNWSLGCYFVQYQINTSVHSAIDKTPYKALFHSDPKIGYCVGTQNALISNIKREEELLGNSVQELCSNELDITVELVPKTESDGIEIEKCDNPLLFIKSEKDVDENNDFVIKKCNNNEETNCSKQLMISDKADIANDKLLSEEFHMVCTETERKEINLNSDTKKNVVYKIDPERELEWSSNNKQGRKRAAEKLETISIKKQSPLDESNLESFESTPRNRTLEQCIVFPS